MQWWSNAARAGWLAVLAWSGGAFADVQIPAGARWEQGDAQLSLGGGNLAVGGRLALGGGLIDSVAGLDLAAGGQLDAGGGTIRVAGPWRNLGNFSAGTSRVEFVDGAVSSADVVGSTRFHQAAWNSGSGKTWRFAAGTTQTFAGRLEIHGVAGQPIRLTSDAPRQVAFFNLIAGGTQDITQVSVTDVHAIGQHLAPTQTNQGGSNALGWFGGVINSVVQIPALSNAMLALLAGLFLLIALRSRRV
jgi:hypothetical protein